MSNKLFIIIGDNLANVEMLKSNLKDIARFSIESCFSDEIKTPGIVELIKQTPLTDLYIAIEGSTFKTIKDELSALLRSIYEKPFANYILLYTTSVFSEDPLFLQGAKHCFYLPPSGDGKELAVHLNNYIVTLFEKSVISNRLTDYIRDSFKEVVYSEILIKKNKEIERLNKELEKRNKIDSLTNLYNRNALFDFLDLELKRTHRDLWRLHNSQIIGKKTNVAAFISEHKHEPIGTLLDHFGIFSIMMIDIDKFKVVNDTYGHLTGDKVLKTAGKLFLNDNILRKNDLACRFGGEEFVVILPETSAAHAIEPANRLVETFSSITFFDEGKSFNVTLSVGVSEFHQTDKSNEDIILRADKALYQAKKLGRGKVVVFESAFPDEIADQTDNPIEQPAE
jgi:diguanylate cyclase (GGDEF)-like protein